MKNRSMIKRIIAISLMTAVFTTSSFCAEPDNNAGLDEMDMCVEDNIATPEIPKKSQNSVRSAIDGLRRSLLKQGLSVSSTRNAEVLHITIPCSSLFAPNATCLKPSAGKVLSPLINVAQQPDMYKILVVVHSDDTGDDIYADGLTEARANAIDDFLWEKAGQTETFVIPYGLGHDEPLVSNDSVINRHKNRRTEIFIVPREGLFKR